MGKLPIDQDYIFNLLIFFFKKLLFIYLLVCFWPCWVFTAVHGFSLAVTSRSCSLIAVHGLLFAVVSLAVGIRLQGVWALVAVAHSLSCPTACGISLDQGSNPHPLCWQVDS